MNREIDNAVIPVDPKQHVVIGDTEYNSKFPAIREMRRRFHRANLSVVYHVSKRVFVVAEIFPAGMREYRILRHWPTITDADWDHLNSQFFTTPAMRKQWERASLKPHEAFVRMKEEDGRRNRGIMRTLGKKKRVGVKQQLPIYHPPKLPGD